MSRIIAKTSSPSGINVEVTLSGSKYISVHTGCGVACTQIGTLDDLDSLADKLKEIHRELSVRRFKALRSLYMEYQEHHEPIFIAGNVYLLGDHGGVTDEGNPTSLVNERGKFHGIGDDSSGGWDKYFEEVTE